MSIYIEKETKTVQRNFNSIKNLFDEKKGNSIVLRPNLIGHKYLTFHVIKVSPKTLNVYAFNKYGWWDRVDHQEPVMKITKDDITVIKGAYSTHQRWDTDKIGTHGSVIRGFISMGMIPNVGIRYLRKGTLIKFNNVEVTTHFPMKFDWEGNLLSRVTKRVKKYTESCYQEDRNTKNDRARANYGNTRVVKLVNNAKKTGDWSKIKPMDAFFVRNVAARTELIEHFTMETILKDISHTVVDTNTIDNRKYKLLRFDFPVIRDGKVQKETREVTYLQMINPSTGETCVEGIPNNCEHTWNRREITTHTVKQALAWRDGENVYTTPIALT
tara:strand:+ start:19486 stop:20469 length:984 start_codon:yes stop_codon:yes gene_type:complete